MPTSNLAVNSTGRYTCPGESEVLGCTWSSLVGLGYLPVFAYVRRTTTPYREKCAGCCSQAPVMNPDGSLVFFGSHLAARASIEITYVVVLCSKALRLAEYAEMYSVSYLFRGYEETLCTLDKPSVK